MGKFYFILFCFLAVCCTAGAQSLDIFNIDASGFPIIKAKFYAFDKEGKQISSLSPSDFSLTENGQSRAITKVSCPPPKPVEKVSIAMSIDISGSMSSAQGTSNVPVELGKTTASNIARIFSLPPNEMALQTCHDKAFINLDYTTNRQRVLDAIVPVTANGGNDFVEHLLNPETGVLNIAKHGKYKRVAILYTDAWWSALTPDELQQCKDTCSKYDIRLYVAIYSRPEAEPNGIKTSLRELTKETGGRFYDGIISKEEALTLAKELKSTIDKSEPCDIEWLSDGACSTDRKVHFRLPADNLESSLTYSAPPNSNISIKLIPDRIISMAEVPLGSFKDTTITISIVNSDVQITNITPSHSSVQILDYGGSAPPFLLKNGESRVLRVRFTPIDSSRIYARLFIENSKCGPVFSYISGGFRGSKFSQQLLKITHPNGSEMFAVGSDTIITWNGIPSSDSVKLDFSMNNGGAWQTIIEKATGLRYNWNVPNIESNQCLIRASSYRNPEDNNDWAKQGLANDNIGRGLASEVVSITVDAYGFSYIYGKLLGDLDFGDGISLTSQDLFKNDGFLAKYSPDGTIMWARRIGSGWSLLPVSVKADNQGNIFITGVFSVKPLDFGNGVVLDFESSTHESFLAKYDDDGNILWAKSIGGEGEDFTTSSVIDVAGNVYVSGTYRSEIINAGNNIILTKIDGGSDSFLIKYNTNGEAIWGKSIGGIFNDEVLSMTTDGYNIIICGKFSSKTIDLGNGISLSNSSPVSSNDYNSFIIKYNSNGELIWGKKAGESYGENTASKITSDKFGDTYVTGMIYPQTSLEFDNGIILTNSGYGGYFYLAKYNNEGKTVWAKKTDHLNDLTTNIKGNLLVGGEFAGDTANFGNGVILKIPGGHYGFIAEYEPEGKALWAKRIIGLAGAFGMSRAGVTALVTDNLENILFTGNHQSTFLDFDNGIINTGLNKLGFFTGKYSVGGTLEQADISDNVFSIVKPLATSHNIDMGRVLVTSSKDSLIQTFITNTGSYPIRIDAVNIGGVNASDFQHVSGIPPFTIPVGDKKAVEFRFKPSAIGARSAELAIITQADTLHQSIIGEGVKPVIQVASSLIDFGIMEVGSLKDTTVTAVLKNIGDMPLTITNTQMLGPDKEQFEIISGGGSFTLASGATQTMQLRFSPKYIGRTSGQIGFDYDGMGGGRPAVVQLFGQGIGGNVYVVDDSAYIGETRDIQLMLGKVKPASVAQTAATSFRATLAFKNSILTPASAVLLKDVAFKKGLDTDTLTVTQQWSAQTSELARIPFIATLGDRLSTDIELLEFDWLDDSGSKIDYDTELQSGVFTVLGICPEGGDRLFDAEGEAQMMLVTPNPVNTTAEIRFKTIEKGHTLITLTDVLGRQIELVSGDYSSGEHSVEIPAGKLTQGIYFLTMQTPTQVFTQRVVVEK